MQQDKLMSHSEFSQGPAFCGQLNQPGLAVDFDLYVDYSSRETTDDQARIEALLEPLVVPGQRLLHIGVGNSQLAQKFAAKGVKVDGVTVSSSELDYAQSLDIADYRVFLTNKYHRDFAADFNQNRFDYIVDNNLASFGCCQYHIYQMVDNYLACLKPGGKILTDQRGMDWALASEGFILDFDSLQQLLAPLPVILSRWSDMVYAIELLATEPAKPEITVYAKRYDDKGQSAIQSFKPAGG
jgi:hypothetical protein